MHNNIEFILSPDILKGIPFDKYEQNFTFIVDGKHFRTSRFLADLISPTIRQYHSIDETIDEFTLDLKEDKPNLTFSNFLQIISFEKAEFTEEELQYYLKILFLLGNREIISKMFPFMKEDLTLNNVFERILYKEKYIEELMISRNPENCSQNDDIKLDLPFESIQEEIDFLAIHFSEIDHEKLKNLNISVLESVISNPQLLLENEDSLFQFIISLYIENSSLAYLFDYVDFLNISQGNMNEFYEQFDFNDINHSIWASLSKRSKMTEKVPTIHKCKEEIRRKEEEERKEKEKQLELERSIPLNLILPYGRQFNVVCRLSDPAQILYDRVVEEAHVEDYYLQLIYEGRKIDRENLISSYNLPRNAMITVLVRTPPG